MENLNMFWNLWILNPFNSETVWIGYMIEYKVGNCFGIEGVKQLEIEECIQNLLAPSVPEHFPIP